MCPNTSITACRRHGFRTSNGWCLCRYEKYTTKEEKKEKGKLTDKFMEAFEGLVEKVTDLTLVSHFSSTMAHLSR